MRRARLGRRSDRKLCALPIPAPHAWKVFLEIQRGLSPAEKLRRALELSALVRGAAEAGLRGLYPLASEREIFLRTARRP